MNNLILFVYESGICLAALFCIYWIFLRKETYFQFNRLYLLGTIVFSCFIPFGNFGAFEFSSQTSALRLITGMGEAVRLPEVIITGGSKSIFSFSDNWQYLVIITYFLVAMLLLARILLGIIKVRNLRKNGEIINFSSYSVVYIKQNFAPFSFFRNIFINESHLDSSQKRHVIDHELIHIRQFHTIDNIIVEIFLALFWFNPFMWLIRRSLRNTHEYLADNGVKKTNTSLVEYQSLLLKQINGLSLLCVTNNFNTKIKTRIIMMCQSKSSVLAKCKTLLIVPVVLSLTLIFACSDSENELQVDNLTAEQAGILKSEGLIEIQEAEVFFIVEEMPSFQDMGQRGFREWIADNLEYPKKAERKGISGKVFVQFIVNSEGEVTGAKIVRGIHPELDAEAIRVVESSPAWDPGKQRGENVDVQFTFPINFVLD